MRVHHRALLVAVVAIAGLGTFLVWHLSLKITTDLKNVGATPLLDVHLVVTGRSYELGDIPPGEQRTARVRPTDESAISIEYRESDGKTQKVVVDCYIEPGYTGIVAADVADGRIVRQAVDIKSSP